MTVSILARSVPARYEKVLDRSTHSKEEKKISRRGHRGKGSWIRNRLDEKQAWIDEMQAGLALS
jgi:hypothetical protein